MERWKVWACALATVVAMAGCDGERVLTVEVVTDYVPAVEVHRVECSLVTFWREGAPVMEIRTQDRALTGDEDAVGGFRVAEFDGLGEGETTVRARLYDRRERLLAERLVRVQLTASRNVRVVVTRDCEGLECPGPDDPANLTTCVGGRCVDERCADESPESCPPAQCEAGADCPARATCALAVCVEGVCLYGSDDTQCDAGEYCDPVAGCRAAPAPTCVEGEACTPGLCRLGALSCDPTERCVDTGAAPPGTPCARGVCDGDGACVACAPGDACVVLGSCRAGVQRCEPASCEDDPGGELVAAGTSCGAGRVCDGTGACVDCAAGTACETEIECQERVLRCDSGAPICELDRDVEAGTSCGSGPDEVCSGDGECVGVLSGVTDVSMGGWHTCAVAGGRAYCWGDNSEGLLGPIAHVVHATPQDSLPFDDVVEVALGWDHSCLRRSDGSVWCWGGDDAQGQLGRGAMPASDTPLEVGLPEPVTSLDCGFLSCCALEADGDLWCWGYNLGGQLGDGTTTPRDTPVAVSAPEPFVEVATGGRGHTCARATSGRVYCWGQNDLGQLGTGAGPTNAPGDPVVGIGDAVSVATNDRGSCAVLMSGDVMCWGNNAPVDWGATGSDFHTTPVRVPGYPQAQAVAMGPRGTCALARDGSVHCAGAEAPPGDGSTNAPMAPVAAAPPADTATELALGGDSHTCVVRPPEGQLYCWGGNSRGQLGDASLTRRLTATPVRAP